MTDAREREREPESALMFLVSALYTEILCMLNAENRQNHFHSDEKKKKKEGRRKMDAGKQRDINVGNHALTGVATFYLFSLTRSMCVCECVSVSERRHSLKVEAIASVKLLQNKWFFRVTASSSSFVRFGWMRAI